MRLIHSSDSETSFLVNFNRQYSLKALMLRITATNGVTPATLEDIGRLRMWIGNDPVVDASFEMFNHLDNLLGGFPRDDSAASGALRMTAIIPMGWKDDNVVLINPTDNARFEIGFGGNFAGRVSAVLVELYAIEESGRQLYIPTYREVSESLAASLYFTKSYPVRNLSALFLSATVSNALNLGGSNLSRIKASIGEIELDASVAAWNDLTQNKHNHEADYTAVASIYEHDTGSAVHPSALYDSVGLTLDNGSGGTSEARIFFIGKMFTPVALAQSSLRVGAQYDSALQQKDLADAGDEVDILRKASPSVRPQLPGVISPLVGAGRR